MSDKKGKSEKVTEQEEAKRCRHEWEWDRKGNKFCVKCGKGTFNKNAYQQ
jgi:hypothetical protein